MNENLIREFIGADDNKVKNFKKDCETPEGCAKKAYDDLRRNIRYVEYYGIGNMEEKKKDEYKDETEKLIARCVKKMPAVPDRKVFDKWHKQTCLEIIGLAKKHNLKGAIHKNFEFTHGLAQKWLNMAIKNMIVMGLYKEEFKKVASVLHVPVDSIILKQACELKIKLPRKGEAVKYGAFSKDATKSWSTWNYDDYIRFQDALRDKVAKPMEWEFQAWNKEKNKNI